MISFSVLDYIVIISFFAIVAVIGYISSGKKEKNEEEYLLSGRKVGLVLFILTNVATWYGGILGSAEFSYTYGLSAWTTQGFPYYFFAILFAIFFSEKIRNSSIYTIPEKIAQTYGNKVAAIATFIIFILVSPAPYLLMIANLISIIFNIGIFPSLLIGIIFSTIYLLKGGYRSYLWIDFFQFFVMFAGFILIVVVSYLKFGGLNYLTATLPINHMKFSGGLPPLYLLVWFFIAMWTFTDPGFHQRSSAAKNGSTAKWGILISVVFFALFDFLTTFTGLYAKSLLPNLKNPMLSYSLYAEKILNSGLKGFFYAGMLATILSTLNSFMFLSAVTFSKDFLPRLRTYKNKDIKINTILGLAITSIISLLMSILIPSVINLWYTIGTICIPGLIIIVMSSYYKKLKITNLFAMVEILSSIFISLLWLFIRSYLGENLSVIEPMLVGLLLASIIHFVGIISRKYSVS